MAGCESITTLRDAKGTLRENMNPLRLIAVFCVASTLNLYGQYVPSNPSGHTIATVLQCVAASGSGTAYTCSTVPRFTPAARDLIQFKADVANTGPATLNVNGTAAKNVLKQGGGTPLVANDFLAGQWVQLIYDGTQWQMQGQAGSISTLMFNGVGLPNATFPLLRFTAIASGEVDLYTVGPGKRLCIGDSSVFNPTGAVPNYTFQVKTVGGAYYAIMAAASVSAGNGGTAITQSICYDAGESLSVLTTGAGLNASFNGVLFDAVSGFKSIKLPAPVTGDNLFYTVPAGKTATVLPATMVLTFNNASAINFMSDASIRTIYLCALASGSTATCTPPTPPGVITGYNSTSGARSTSVGIALNLQAGDFIVFNISVGAATQYAWINVLEF